MKSDSAIGHHEFQLNLRPTKRGDPKDSFTLHAQGRPCNCRGDLARNDRWKRFKTLDDVRDYARQNAADVQVGICKRCWPNNYSNGNLHFKEIKSGKTPTTPFP